MTKRRLASYGLNLVGVTLLYAAITLTFTFNAFGKSTTYIQGICTTACYTIIMVTSLNLVVGFMGEFSMGHAGFVSVGAYVSAIVSGALAGRPSWVYYPDGLKKLKAHDENSQVSYLETLRVYLDNNLSVTKTAAALYLHRSTLLDRLAHITQMLGCDLKNPDFCLTLGILLRAELQQKRITQPKP